MDVERVFQVVFAYVFQIFQVAGFCISTRLKLGPITAQSVLFQPFVNVLLFIQELKPNNSPKDLDAVAFKVYSILNI